LPRCRPGRRGSRQQDLCAQQDQTRAGDRVRQPGFRLPGDVGESELIARIEQLNADPAVDGILVQLPLPQSIDPARVLGAIDPAKDVDGLHAINSGRLIWGTAGLLPCTPLGCMILIRDTAEKLPGRTAVVVGRSALVGKPMALLLLAADCTVTLAHSKSRDLPELCRHAEILVAAVGRPEMVRGNWIRPGAIVIDVGINRVRRGDSDVLVGDAGRRGPDDRCVSSRQHLPGILCETRAPCCGRIFDNQPNLTCPGQQPAPEG
jgi:methylenetetrahydrofolate dehydrogenase (NADP+)/methenyltetrahydrofolate cyclohydrolase